MKKTFTFSWLSLLLVLLAIFLGTSPALAFSMHMSNPANAGSIRENSPPVIIYEYYGSSDVGEQVRLTIKAYDPDTGDRITLKIDSAEAWGSNTAPSLSELSFSPSLPFSSSDTAVIVMQWVPRREQLGFIAFHFSALDQHGNQMSDYALYFVDIPLIIAPLPPLQLAVNEAFEMIIPVEDADWHQLGEATLMENTSGWLQTEIVTVDATGGMNGMNAIRLYGKPGTADIGSHSLTLYVRALFGKEAYLNLQISIANCRNQLWYRDSDGDGYGAASGTLTSCTAPAAYVSNAGDCDDGNARIHPDALEIAADGIDNNCNGVVDEAASCLIRTKLSLTTTCSDQPGIRQWKINNPNNCAVAVQWKILHTQQTGSLIAPPGESYFTSAAVGRKHEYALISWTDSKGKTRSTRKAASKENCGKKEKLKQVNKRKEEPALVQMEEGIGLQAYPMPFSSKLNLHYSKLSPASTVSIYLYSVNGQQFNLSQAVSNREDEKLLINMEGFPIPAGLYILKLWIDDQEPVFIRVIKKPE